MTLLVKGFPVLSISYFYYPTYVNMPTKSYCLYESFSFNNCWTEQYEF